MKAIAMKHKLLSKIKKGQMTWDLILSLMDFKRLKTSVFGFKIKVLEYLNLNRETPAQ